MRESSRARIVAGSVAAFARKGFHASSMEDVATEAGVSKGLPYTYFRSKEDLLVETIRDRIGHLFSIAAAVDPAQPPEARLASIVDALFTHVRKAPEVFRLYLALTLEKSLAPVAARTRRALSGYLESYLGAVRQAFADLGSEDPDLDALLFRSALLGTFIHHVRHFEDVPFDAVRDRLIAAFSPKSRSKKGGRR